MSNGQNSFDVPWSAISFFEEVLNTHTAVDSFTRKNDIQFEIVRSGKLSDVNAILLSDYTLGEAVVHAALSEFDGVTAVVNNGIWNHVAFDWHAFHKQTGVVVFEFRDFLGALNVDNLAKYTPQSERKERSGKRRRSS